MTNSEWLADFVATQTDHVFCVTGGAAVNLLDPMSKTVKLVPLNHEQSCAMAADAYARLKGFGVCVATSGPGATNLLTGISCSYFDSIPVLAITGQVPTSQWQETQREYTRQLGFQETSVVDIFGPVTKDQAFGHEGMQEVICGLVDHAKQGRPGPVLIDIPDDAQRTKVGSLTYIPTNYTRKEDDTAQESAITIITAIEQAERPVLILGAGMRQAGLADEAQGLVEALGIPTLLTWGALDYLDHNHPLNFRDFGVTGARAGNFIVQNADLILTLGTRLDTHETGADGSLFAPNAKKLVVDIDIAELDKYTKRGIKTQNFVVDLRDIVPSLIKVGSRAQVPTFWMEYCCKMLREYQVVPDVDVYQYLDMLSDIAPDNAIIISDAGCTVTWTMQGWKVKKGQRLITAFNQSPMGYALPASIGAQFACPDRPVICLTGDGGLMMNIQELASVAHYNLPIKIFVLNNDGYGMIKQTQETWLGGRYVASDDVPCKVDFEAIANAFELDSYTFRGLASPSSTERANIVNTHVLEKACPVLCNVFIYPDSRIIPKLSFGKSIEYMSPELPEDEFRENMIG